MDGVKRREVRETGILSFFMAVVRVDRGQLYWRHMGKQCLTISGHLHNSQFGESDLLHQKRWAFRGQCPSLSYTIDVERGRGRLDNALKKATGSWDRRR